MSVTKKPKVVENLLPPTSKNTIPKDYTVIDLTKKENKVTKKPSTEKKPKLPKAKAEDKLGDISEYFITNLIEKKIKGVKQPFIQIDIKPKGQKVLDHKKKQDPNFKEDEFFQNFITKALDNIEKQELKQTKASIKK